MSNKKLVIVESSAKCKKIQGYLGKNYIVKACMGHTVNIDTKLGLKAIDINNNYKIKYRVIADKKKYLTELIKISKTCSEVIIASDLDREGEAIGFHLITELKLDITKTKRIIFNEISKTAIQHAIQHPTLIDINMVKSQQTRQALDYLIGFSISPLLWKHIKNKISAGRCQSCALHLIHLREKSIKDFKNNSYFNLESVFLYKKKNLNTKSPEIYKTDLEVIAILNELKDATFKIKSINNTLSKSNPPSPYITTSIQQDASSTHGLSPKSTMKYLQNMYEKGKITYMRTDSKIISDTFSKTIESYIKENYSDTFYENRIYKNNSKNVQEAHECIRPVDITITELDDTFADYEKKLYSLIWKRTVASQMTELKIKVYKIIIENTKNKILFNCHLEKPVFLGYKILYNYKSEDHTDIINILKANETVDYITITSYEKNNKTTLRYNEASLIKDLESKGIGRPSTYSNIIDTLFKREYVKKDSNNGITKNMEIISLEKGVIQKDKKETVVNKETNKIFITELGEMVDIFMNKHFNSIINCKFTSNLEEDLDKIAIGTINYIDIVDNVYKKFISKVKELSNAATDKSSTWENNNTKKLVGVHPSTKNAIYVYNGKFGSVIQEGDQTVKHFSIPKNKDISIITLDECVHLMSLPKQVGLYKNKSICLCCSSYGYYIQYDSKNFSINNDIVDLDNININDFIDIINNTTKKLLRKISETIEIIDGQYGPYIMKYNKNRKNKIVGIPKNKIKDIDTFTIDDCKKLLLKK